MEHSGWSRQVVASAVVALELVSRLALPASVLALAHGHASFAVTGSLVAAAAALGKNLVQARLLRDTVTGTWRRLIDGALRQTPDTLRLRREDRAGVLTLADGARALASHQAMVVPAIAALSLALAVVVVTVAVVLGPAWLALGALVGAGVGGLALLGQRLVRGAAGRAWHRLGEVARDVRVLLEATVELRASDRERPLAAEILRNVDAMASEERAAAVWSAGIGGLPAALAVLAVAAPVRAGLRSMLAGMAPERIADVGVLGAASLSLGIGLTRTVSSAVASAPLRATLRDFLARASATPLAASRTGGQAPRSLALASFELRGVTCIHPGATHATPAGVDFLWQGQRGLAVSGDNGSGKSTLALALLGLHAPAAGGIAIDGVPLSEIDLESYRRRVAYVPQGAFIAPGESVKWHLQIIAGPVADDARVDAALARVGLLAVLEEHAVKTGGAARDVPAGELSGGERQRMLLARALLQDAELVMLDEPEAGIDATGRALLRALLEELAATRRVLVIAHDESVVPTGFARLRCHRAELAPPQRTSTPGSGAPAGPVAIGRPTPTAG